MVGVIPLCQVYSTIVRSLEHLVIVPGELTPVLREAVSLLAEATTDGGITAGQGREHGLVGTGLLLSCLYTASASSGTSEAASRAGRGGAAATGPSAPVAGRATSGEVSYATSQLAISRATPLLNRLLASSHVDGALLAEYVRTFARPWRRMDGRGLTLRDSVLGSVRF